MTLDMTNIIVAIIGGVFSIIGLIATYLINQRMTDKQAAATLSAAIVNSLGKGAQAADGVVMSMHPTVKIPGVPASLQVQTQYVLDHAGEEATRFGMTPEYIADKIDAKIGLAKISVSANPTPASPPVVILPSSIVPQTPASTP